MAIRILKTVPLAELEGKFICSPSLLSEQDHGFPAVIEKVTASQLVFRRLHRGLWDAVAKEWEVNPSVDSAEDASLDDRIEAPAKCKQSSVSLVCDTAVEAISLYTQAVATRKAIQSFRANAMAELNTSALEGRLPVPAYLNARR